MDNIFKTTLETILRFFKENHIDYVLIGAWAASYWGQPRATEDFDFLVMLSEEDFEKFKKNLGKAAEFEIDVDWEKHNPMVRKTHARLKHKNVIIDVSLPRTELDQTALKRRVEQNIGDLTIALLTPEDSILQKLRTGRGKDFDDALAIFIKQQKCLDLDYLRSWAKKLGVYEELNWLFTQGK